MARKSHTPGPNVLEISDTDLWSSLRASGRGMRAEDTSVLAEAIILGERGKHAEAYAALGVFHRVSLAWRWRDVEEIAYRWPEDHEKRLKVALETKLWERQWRGVALGHKNWLGWAMPVLREYIETRDAKLRRFLIRTVEHCYAIRAKHPVPPRVEHPIFGALSFDHLFPHLVAIYVAMLRCDDRPEPRLTEAVMKFMLGGGRYLYRRVIPFRVHNVHTGACGGLWQTARVFPEFRESVKWDRRATTFLHRTLKESFFADGGHRERVWGYGYYTVRRLQLLYETAQAAGGFGEMDRDFRSRLRNAYRWFAKSLGPGGFKPAYGDCELFPGRFIIDDGQSLFPECKDDWLGVDRSQSYLLKSSGFAIMRNGDGDKSTYLNTTFGKFFGWHSHHDTLSMNLFAYGKPLLEEMNRFSSYGNPLDMVGRAPASHNQVLIDEFFYDSRGKPAKDVVFRSDDEIDYFSAYHQAYRWLPNVDTAGYIMSMDARIRRTIVFVKRRGYVVILDTVEDELAPGFNRAITSHWHSPFPFTPIDATTAMAGQAPGCLVKFAYPDGLKKFLIEPDYAGDDAAPGEIYPERYHLRARRWFRMGSVNGTGYLTLLYPFPKSPPKVEFTPIELANSQRFAAEGVEVRSRAGVDRLLLNPQRMAGPAYRGRPLSFRAEIRLAGCRKPFVIE